MLSYDSKTPSSLSRVGVTALCIGKCDSEMFATHGVFWTNQSAQKRFWRESSSDSITEEEEQRKLRGRAKEEVTKSVYGIGVVYYLDQIDRIKGIMLWGLPFVSSLPAKNVVNNSDLQGPLLEFMREILISNGNAIKSDDYYMEQRQKLVRTAFSNRFRQAQQDH